MKIRSFRITAPVVFLSLLLPAFCFAADLRDMSYRARDIADALRSADDARYAFERATRGSNDYLRLEQAWREREYALEEARLRAMARDMNRSADELREMRRSGRGWDDICRAYNCRRDSYGFDKRRYAQFDRDRDFWKDYYSRPGKARGHHKGTPDGPPGQYKKDKKGKGKDRD